MANIKEQKHFKGWAGSTCPYEYVQGITRIEYVEPGVDYNHTGSTQVVKGKLKKDISAQQLGLLYDDFVFGGHATIYEDGTFTVTYNRD